MAFDAGMLACVIHELKTESLGARVEKVYQPQADEILIQIRSREGGRKLLINAGSNNPRIGFSFTSKENPPVPPMFCLFLRKHLQGAKLSAVEQEGFERVVRMEFETRDEMGFACKRMLYAEIMGKYSNLIFTDGEGKVMSSLKTVDFSTSSLRQVLPGMRYELPPAQDKRNPLEATEEEFRTLYAEATEDSINETIARGLAGEAISSDEAEAMKTELIVHCAAEYAKRGWVMQLHYNCMRNPNSQMFARLGADTGFDCIGPDNGSRKLASLLDRMNRENSLPKTVIYSLDPTDNAFIDTLIGAFQGSEIAGKLQHGSAWWFNDNKQGMRDQLISLANLSLLGNFVGMLTDSRSFLSYTRHEYFRRILCGLIGEWVENGEYPNDNASLSALVEDICYNNAKKYFGL